MGTSTSSSGGKAGSPFDPEWLTSSGTAGGAAGGEGTSDADGEPSGEGGTNGQQDGGAEETDADFAPSRRFAEARTKMSAYLAGGGRPALGAAAKSMVTRGMGGPSRAASTMRGTSQGAGALGQFLVSARDGSDARVADWVSHARESNTAADDLIVELVKEVMPSTGSIDDESLRNAAAEALSLLYERNPDIDIFNLTDAEIHDVMAITIANDVCNRMHQQLGQAYEKLKYEPQRIQLYLQDIKEYVQSEVRVVMERHGSAGLDPKSLAHEVLKSTLEVFAS